MFAYHNKTQNTLANRKVQRKPIIYLIICGLMLFSSFSNVYACEGRYFNKSVSIIESVYFESVKIGKQIAWGQVDFNSGFQRAISLTKYLNNESGKLPLSCQRLINAWASIIADSVTNPRGGTQCSSGVCCDSSSCYGG